MANSDFSSGKRPLEHWVVERGATATAALLDTANFVSSGGSLRLHSSGEKRIVCMQYLNGKNGRPALKPNARYRLSFNAKLDGVIGDTYLCGVRLVINDVGNHNYPPPAPLTGTCDWTHYVFEHVAASNANVRTPAYVRIRMDGSVGTVWIDDVRLEEIESPVP